MSDCPPRWVTPRTRRRTQGPEVAAVARQLGYSLLPWQRQALSVALERSGRRPAYRDVSVSVPRQSGKSTLALSLIVWKLLDAPDHLVLYAAQNRVAARRKMLYSWWPKLLSSELAGRFTLFRGFGNETISCDNGSRLELLSATESSGHGDSTHLCLIDEAWVHADPTLEQAVRPTMLNEPTAQLWALSTAGTPRSVWWRDRLEGARAAAEMGVTDRVALAEWAAPAGADPASEATWWQAMPALGRLASVETVRADFQAWSAKGKLPQFCRAYLNVWEDETEQGWKVIPKSLWEELQV